MDSAVSPIARDPTVAVETHRPDDKFIPLRARTICDALIKDAPQAGLDRAATAKFLEYLEAIVEQETGFFERELAEMYAPFNPDRDTLVQPTEYAARTPEGYALLSRRLDHLFEKANFARLNDVVIGEALRVASSHGISIRLDPTRIHELTLWVRGSSTIVRRRWDWRHPIRGTSVTLPVYQRLAVVARLRDDPNVLIKLFKDIPKEDIEALLPHAEVSMNWLDRCFMFSGGLGAIGPTALKILTAGIAAVGWGLWTLTVLLGTIAWRTIRGYRTTRLKRDTQRTRHLYYQNLANNLGSIFTLISLIAQEELKEAALAYFSCAAAEKPIASEPELKARVEDHLRRRFSAQVCFDVADATESLGRYQLWNDRASFRVLPIDQAAALLQTHWAERRSVRYHEMRPVNDQPRS
ncbi:MAG: DUF3754 domain-containing protein [Planctomycetes bacterium]|nr:DUF3754 domain-containing protein [Planctomycetota bacterium]